jgi:predicted peptidase
VMGGPHADAAVDPGDRDSGSAARDAGALDDPDAGALGDPDAGSPDAGAPDGGPIIEAGPPSTRQTARPVGSTAATIGYYEYLPPGYGTGTFPLLVFLHGVGENGNGDSELSRVLAHGPPRLIARDEWTNERPFIVLSPQHPGGGCPGAGEIHDFISYAMESYDVDPSRVYLTGLSCGAIGAWGYLGAHLDEQITAMVPIAGDGRGAWSRRMCELGDVAIWGFHGDADGTVGPAGTIDAMSSLIGCPAPPRRDAILTVYPGVGHDSWSRTYDGSAGHDIYGWLLMQRRP